MWGVRAKWSVGLHIDVDPRLKLLSPTKELTVGGISPPIPRQDDHVTEAKLLEEQQCYCYHKEMPKVWAGTQTHIKVKTSLCAMEALQVD